MYFLNPRMIWLFVIPLALGISILPATGIANGWLVAVLIMLSAVMYWLFSRRRNILPILAFSCFAFGGLYANVRGLLTEPSASSATLYKVPPPIASWEVQIGDESLSDAHRAVLHAMLLGDRTHLEPSQKQLFRRAGAQHLLALSGLHLGILITLVSILILRRVRFTRWRWPVLIATLSLLWFYAFMVGMPKSLQRALLMSSLFLVGSFLNRPTRGYEVLGSSVFFMLMIDPLCVMDIGAQLSVAALVGLTVFYPVLEKAFLADGDSSRVKIKQALRNHTGTAWLYWHKWSVRFAKFFFVSLSAWLFTMPIVLYYFHQFQLWQPLVSIVLVPLTTVVMYLAVFSLLSGLLALPLVTSALTWALEKLMVALDASLRFSASLPLSNVEVQHITLWHVVLIYLLIGVLWVVAKFRSFRILVWAFAASLAILSLLFMTIGAD